MLRVAIKLGNMQRRPPAAVQRPSSRPQAALQRPSSRPPAALQPHSSRPPAALQPEDPNLLLGFMLRWAPNQLNDTIHTDAFRATNALRVSLECGSSQVIILTSLILFLLQKRLGQILELFPNNFNDLFVNTSLRL